MPFEQLCLFLFGFISLFLYTLIVITIKRQKGNTLLGGSFFQIVEMQYYAELVFFIEFSLTMRFRKYSSLHTFFEADSEINGVFPRFVSGIHYYIKIVVYIGYGTFAINRLTSAWNLSAYNNVKGSIWTTKLMTVIMISKWLFPLIFVLPTHAWPQFKFWLIITTSSIRLMNDELSTSIVAYIDGACCSTTCLFCTVCYSMTVYFIRKNWKQVNRDTVFKKTSAQASAERSLFISALLSFFVLTLNTCFQIVTIMNSWGAMKDLLFIQDLSYPMIDLMYSHFPWVLLATSSVLRKQMIYEVKSAIRKKLKLDDASMNTIRVGNSTNPVTRMTTTMKNI